MLFYFRFEVHSCGIVDHLPKVVLPYGETRIALEFVLLSYLSLPDNHFYFINCSGNFLIEILSFKTERLEKVRKIFQKTIKANIKEIIKLKISET